MEKRDLGQGIGCGAIGLGCMSMSGQYGAFDDTELRATLRRAVELGVTLFDTADVYGPFANEALVGRELAPFRRDVTIATKFGLVRASTGQHLGINGRPDYVKFSCDLSLQRLGVDCIDVYFQHRVDPDVPIEETVGAMADLVKAGKVRHIGLCEVGAATIRRAHKVHPLTAVQSEYSLWRGTSRTRCCRPCANSESVSSPTARWAAVSSRARSPAATNSAPTTTAARIRAFRKRPSRKISSWPSGSRISRLLSAAPRGRWR